MMLAPCRSYSRLDGSISTISSRVGTFWPSAASTSFSSSRVGLSRSSQIVPLERAPTFAGSMGAGAHFGPNDRSIGD